MKKLTILLFSALVAMPSMAQLTTVHLNKGWKFHIGQSPATTTKAQASDWQDVCVPHDYLIEQPWVAPSADEKADNSDAGANIKSRLSARGFKELDNGTYLLTYTPEERYKGQRAVLDFQGIMYVADVYLNGERIGGTDYGYVGFEIDVTKKLKYGQENTILVCCGQGNAKSSRWYTGGGLFRDVTMNFTDPQLYFNRHPLYITTTDNKKVDISANVQCNTKDNQVTMQVTITDPNGNVVSNGKYDVKRNRNYKFGQDLKIPTITIDNPQLWDCENPNLYTARVELLRADGTVADTHTKRFGIRTVEIVPNVGLKLNGKKVLMKGYANHHTNGALGASAYRDAIEKRVKLMKAFGMNHIRTSHNPYSESFLDVCDENGILVVDELYDKWNDQYVGAGRAHFADLWQQHVPEFITRDRNHPCVIAWSLGNEMQSYNDQPYNDFGVTIFKLMRTLIQRYDNTRKVTAAMHPRYRNWETDSLPCDLAMVTDFQSYNYRYMYFPGDGKRFPWMTFYQSEASVSAMGENFFAMDRDKTMGLAYWGAIDYLGESQGWPAKGWEQGVFDISLEAKPKAYYMKSFFKPEEPLVHIAVTESKNNRMWNGVQTGNDGQSDHWNRTPGQKLEITTYTNAEEVELFVNGKSYGVKKNDLANAKMRNQIRWKDIEYKDGYCEAVARTNGKVVARHKIETTGKPVKLMIVNEDANKAPRSADLVSTLDGNCLTHLRVIAVDSKGRRVNTATGDVKVKVEGNAALAAMSNGNIYSDELNMVDHRMLFNGSCLAILRSASNAGVVTVTATCDGLKPAKLKITL